MKRYPGLRRKDLTFYFQKRIPRDLRHHYDVDSWSKSLETRDFSVAVIRWAEAVAEITTAFNQLRTTPWFTPEHTLQHIIAQPEPVAAMAKATKELSGQAQRIKDAGSLDALFDVWAKEGNKAASSIATARIEWERLPRKAARDITKQDIQKIRNERVAEGKGIATVRKFVRLVRAIFQVAVQEDLYGVTSNPAKDVAVKSGKPALKRPNWTEADVEKFRAAYPEGSALRALFELGRHTGARINELVQLRPEDVVLTEPERLEFVESEGRRFKTREQSERRVPLVHPEALRAAQLVKGGCLQGVAVHAWGDRFSRATQALGIKTRFQSLRHTWKYWWRHAGLPKEQGDALQGHTNKDVSDKYGSAWSYPLKPLRESMLKLSFDDDE